MPDTRIEPFFEAAALHRSIDFAGISIRVLVPSSATGGAFAMFDERTAPRGGPPLHVHESQIEVFRVLEGTNEFMIAGQRFPAGPGDTAVVPAGAEHSFWNTGETDGRLLFTLSPGADAEAVFADVAAFLVGDGPPDIVAINAAFAARGLRMVGPPLAVLLGGEP